MNFTMKYFFAAAFVCYLAAVSQIGSVSGQSTNSTLNANETTWTLEGNNSTDGMSTATSEGSSTSSHSTTDATTTTTTTTAATTTTTVAPAIVGTAPQPPVNSYQLKPQNGTAGADKFCILVSSAVQLTVNYVTENQTMAKTTFNADGNWTVVAAQSRCGNETSGEDAILAVQYDDFQLNYTFASQGGKYSLAQMSLGFNLSHSHLFPDSDPKDVNVHVLSAMTNETFSVSKDRSYRCDVDKLLNLADDHLNGTATVSSFKFAAFGHFDAADNFGEAEECSDDFTTSDIVPIAVGCALAALVVIVLIAYLIGRRRSRQKGYQSV